jgi:hypothetical protein
MKIIESNNKRILILDFESVDLSDGAVIEYMGNYYTKKNELDETGYLVTKFVLTKFIGVVERYKFTNGIITGIYVRPLFIIDPADDQWKKIVNYKEPVYPINKYFFYPHLLILPNEYYHYYPIYCLHTCKNRNTLDFQDIIATCCL